MSASLPGLFNLQEFTDAGALAAGYRLYTYIPSTTTLKLAYTDAAGTIPHTYTSDGSGGQYIALNSRGELPAPLFLLTGGYTIALKRSDGTTVWSRSVSSVSDEASAGILADLSNSTDAAKGPALIAYGPSMEYPAGTVGGELRTIQSQAAHFWRRIRTNQSDVNVLVLGDSTGNETTEWVYLMAQWLAGECPTHTVKYRLFGLGATVPNGGTETWGSYTTLQTGSGPMPPLDVTTNTIFVDNASVGGTNTNYVEGGREAVIWGSTDYDLVIFNFGHNTGTDTTEEIAQPEFMTAVCNARLHAPRAGLLITLQNFRTSTSGKAQSYRMWNAWRNVASQLGAGVIDVGTAFASVPDVSIYMADETHPNALGMSALWLPQVQRTIAEPRNYTGEDPGSVSPFSLVKTCYTANPRFSSWTSTNPDGWTFSNCTTAKDTGKTEGTAYSLRVTNGAGTNPQITQDLSSQLVRLKGRVVTVVARVWRSSGLNLLAGRVGLTSNNGTTSVSATSYPRSVESAGGWEWSQVSICVQSDATSLTLVAYTGAADGSDNTEQIWFDSIAVFESSMPGAVSTDDVWRKTVLDFYSDGNVGLVPSTTTGSVTASSGTITLTGATSPNSGVYINLPGLAYGKTYKASFTPVSATGGTMQGGVYCRNGYNGGSTDFAKASGTGDWTAGGGAVSFTFVAPAGAVSLWAYGFTGVTAWQHSGWSIKPVESGISRAINLPLQIAKTIDGTTLPTTASTGQFGITQSAGSASYLRGEDAQGNTKTDAVTWELTLPNDYIAGRDVTFTVNAYYIGTGTVGTKTLTLLAYSIADATGNHTSLTVSAAGTLTNAAADYAFTITGTNLTPGQRVLLRLTAVLQETGGVNILAPRINSARLS